MDLNVKFIRTSKVLDKKAGQRRCQRIQWLRGRDADPGIPGTFLEHWHCMALLGSAPQNELYALLLFFLDVFQRFSKHLKVSKHSKFWRCKSEMYSIHFHFSFHFASPCHRFSSTSLSDKCQIWSFSKLHLFSSTTAAACYMAPGLQQLCQKLLQPQTMLQLSRLATPATTHLGQGSHDAEFKCYACYPKTVKSRWHLCLEAELVAQRCHPARNEEEMSLNVKTSQVQSLASLSLNASV